MLNRKVSRRTSRVKSVSSTIKDLKDKKLLCANSSERLEGLFTGGLSSEVIINHFKNQNWIATGRRHSYEAKKIAMTSHFHSV